MRLFLFIAFFLLLYGGMHLYFFMKVKRALSLGIPALLVLTGVLVIMVLSPILIRALERWGLEETGRGLAYAAYIWMGFLFLYFVFSLPGDITLLLFPRLLKPGTLFAVTSALALTASIYGVFEALDVRIEHITVQSAKIKSRDERIRIAQISDVHLGLLFRERRLSRVLQRLKEAEADLVVSTGDLVDGQTDGLSGALELLKAIRPPMGKYAVTGNHEYYAGIVRSVEFIREAGFKVLRAEAVRIQGRINIAGVDDPAGGNYSEQIEEQLLSALPRDTFTLLLKHRPHVTEASTGLFDLQLSGHTHNGQIFPFGLFVKLVHGRLAGLYGLPSGSLLYVSRGSGTWGPPIRLLSPPEVTVIDIIPLSDKNDNLSGRP